MGNYLSFGRSNAGQESSDSGPSQAYLYPPKMGSYFTSHFIMGGKPSPFPYAAPLPHEPTRTLRALINIRKESLRFLRVTNSALIPVVKPESSPRVTIPTETTTKSNALDVPEKVKGGRTSSTSSVGNISNKEKLSSNASEQSVQGPQNKEIHYNIEFTFDCDVKCAITIYYFATEEITNLGVTYTPRDPSICSDTVVFKRGSNQIFTHETHILSPFLYNEDDLMYRAFDENGYFDPRVPFPCVIHCVALEGDLPRQSHALIAVIEKNNNGSFSIKPFIQKTYIDGLFYLLQEIYGIENKNVSTIKSTEQYISPDDDVEDSGSECVVCLSDSRDTLILPCRHLCLCNACADSLRYQANNCPICRAPFRALLQIQAVRKAPRTIHMQHVISGSTLTPITQPAQGLMGSTSDIVDVPPGYEPYSLIEALNGPNAVHQPSASHGMYSFRGDLENRTPLGSRRSLGKDRVREDVPLPIRRTATSTPEVVIGGRIESLLDKSASTVMKSTRKGSDGSTSNEDVPTSRGRRLIGDHESTSSAGSSNTQETTKLLSTDARKGLGDSKSEPSENSCNLPLSRKSFRNSSLRGGSTSPRTPKELVIVTSHSTPSADMPSSSYAVVSLNDGFVEQQCMNDEGFTPGSVIRSPADDDEDETRLFVDASSSFDEPAVTGKETLVEMDRLKGDIKLAEFETTDDLDVPSED